jgi:hypothetical protein
MSKCIDQAVVQQYLSTLGIIEEDGKPEVGKKVLRNLEELYGEEIKKYALDQRPKNHRPDCRTRPGKALQEKPGSFKHEPGTAA